MLRKSPDPRGPSRHPVPGPRVRTLTLLPWIAWRSNRFRRCIFVWHHTFCCLAADRGRLLRKTQTVRSSYTCRSVVAAAAAAAAVPVTVSWRWTAAPSPKHPRSSRLWASVRVWRPRHSAASPPSLSSLSPPARADRPRCSTAARTGRYGTTRSSRRDRCPVRPVSSSSSSARHRSGRPVLKNPKTPVSQRRYGGRLRLGSRRLYRSLRLIHRLMNS